MADAGPPRFVSTRDERPEPKLYTLDDAVLLGWAPPDEAGGLPGMFVPTAIPTLSKAELQRWRGLSYKEVCFELLSLFRDDESSVITSDELRSLVLDSECKLVPVPAGGLRGVVPVGGSGRSGAGEVEGIEDGGARARHQDHCPTCVLHSRCFHSLHSRLAKGPGPRGPHPAPRASPF